ncbi:MAG: DNA polymerase III subunit alpha [Ignavibacteriales bacterium]|nr:DNA polymerase III subunit alpha [Ignavibacteriales bacterium]
MSEFIHLHNHSHYSLQDGACTIDTLLDTTIKNNMSAIALTDHGVMYGAFEFYKKARERNIKPIIGIEAYITLDGSRFEKGKGSDDNSNGRKQSKHYNHLILLAKNKDGYKNLIKLSTIGFLEGFYYKPRIDLEVLEKYKDNLICTTACAHGIIPPHLISGEYEKAKRIAKKFKDLFGDDFYLEIQDHNLPDEKIIIQGMAKLSKDLNIKLVATNDIHYIEKGHAIAHNILLLLSDKTGNADYHQLRYQTDEIYFKSADEMVELFKDYPQAIESTLEISDKVNISLDEKKHQFPNFPIPKDSKAKTLEEYLRHVAEKGLGKRFDVITDEISKRFEYELDVINKMGFAGYFLIVQDFIKAAKERNIPVGCGRGSAAGSLVAYALEITEVNPLEYNLLFERFLNPARRSMPDIDIDFADDQREKIIQYVKEKYGEESVCQIITFNRLSSKAVIKDVARVLKISIQTAEEITKKIPSKFGKVYSIDQALNEVIELKEIRDSKDPMIIELLKYSRVLEGMNRNASKHAAGVVITPGPAVEHVPLCLAGNDNEIVSQFNMKDLEDVGLLKMDFLGLRTLSIIRDTVELVKKTRNEEIDIYKIPLNDAKTYELFSKGQTTGVFQFESAPMREYLKKLKPNCIEDLAAMNALHRPGPMENIDDFIGRKQGKKKVQYLSPLLEPILMSTYGIIVYQEQIIQIANQIGGMSLAEADILRRAMGKKLTEAMKKQKEAFVRGAQENNINKKIANDIFILIDKFANYGFNKSHAVAYSIIAYQTAFLKTYHLEEFLAANLTNEVHNPTKVTNFLEDCRKLNIKVLPPNVNKPSVYFNVEEDKIIFGMSAIKNVGINAVEEIISTHNKIERDFTSIFDFCANVDNRIINKRALESLILAGAFDYVKGNRAQNYEVVESAIEYGRKVKNIKEKLTDNLFGREEDIIKIDEPKLPNVQQWETKEMLSRERKVLGFYLTDHPLRKYEYEYFNFASVHLGETENCEDGSIVRVCGVITNVKIKYDKAEKKMAIFSVDDFSGSCDCIIFSRDYQKYSDLIKMESTILAIGKLESSGDSVKIMIQEIIPLADSLKKLTKKIVLELDEKIHSYDTILELRNIFENNIGEVPIYLRIKQENGNREFSIDFKISPSKNLIDTVTSILGPNSLSISLI